MWSTLFAGSLLLLISFTTNYGDDNLSNFASLPAHDQVGVGLHLAAPWRRLLAMLNWRHVYDIEQEELACEKHIKQIESEIEQLKQDNARLAALNSRMDALLLAE